MPQSLSKTRVLVVDDNRDAAELIADLLALRGYDALCAFDGYEALVVAESFRPHAVLLDIGMPRMNGLEAAAAFRANSLFERVRLIALTAWSGEKVRQQASENGFDDYLVKPASFDSIIAAIEPQQRPVT